MNICVARRRRTWGRAVRKVLKRGMTRSWEKVAVVLSTNSCSLPPSLRRSKTEAIFCSESEITAYSA
ncbi:hypothetical protein D3C81_1120710 [compost metagenome]